MKNFKSRVPADIQAKIKEIADSITFRELISGNQESISEQNTNEIEGNYRSGWIPKQDGGFVVDQLFYDDSDSSHHFTKEQTQAAYEDDKRCFKSFLSDHGLDEDTEYDALTDEQKEQLAEYENDWHDPALLQFQIFADYDTGIRSEPANITMRLSINYKDAPYYREKYAQDIKTLILEPAEFMAKPVSEIIEQFKI
jgi:hypothetical protein